MSRRPLVAIAGGGPVGLFASIQLARYGVRSVVFEHQAAPLGAAYPGSSHQDVKSDTRNHPRAHVLHPRSMELLRDCGLEKAAMKLVPPSEHWRKFRYCKNLLGSAEDSLLAEEDHFLSPEYRMLPRVSPCRVAQLSQPRLEELLRAEHVSVGIATGLTETRYECKVNSVAHKNKGGGGVVVNVSQTSNSGMNKEINIDADYVIAADGARSVIRNLLGIGTVGEHDMEAFASLHFGSRKLGKVLSSLGQGAMLSFVFNDKQMGVVVSHDMRREDWVIHIPFFPPAQGFERFTENGGAYSLQAIKDCIGVADRQELAVDDIELRSVRAWGMHGVCAERFSGMDNRVFLVGDAAHQFPPSGGFGVNAGLADAHNLAWKLAHALDSDSDSGRERLLASYDLERRPAIQDALSVAIDNYRRGLEPARALGLDRAAMATSVSLLAQIPGLSGASRESTVENLLWAGKQHLRAPASLLRPSVEKVVLAERKALPLIFPRTDRGFRYQGSPALVQEQHFLKGNKNKAGLDCIKELDKFWLRPSFPRDHQTMWDPTKLQSGCVLPHAWLRDTKSRKRLATVDLLKLNGNVGKYVFLCTERKLALAAKEQFAAFRHRLGIVLLSSSSQENISASSTSNMQEDEDIEEYQFGSEAAAAIFAGKTALIRPDAHIAWGASMCAQRDLDTLQEFIQGLM